MSDLTLTPDDELVALAIVELLDTPLGDECIEQVRRVADTASARSVADRHLAMVLRRALDLHRHRKATEKPQ